MPATREGYVVLADHKHDQLVQRMMKEAEAKRAAVMKAPKLEVEFADVPPLVITMCEANREAFVYEFVPEKPQTRPVTWQEVYKTHREHMSWNSTQIARHLGCVSGYVRAVAARKGWKIPKDKRYMNRRGRPKKNSSPVAECSPNGVVHTSPADVRE